MGRSQKAFSGLPTHQMRNVVWSRVVKQALLPDSDPARPFANRINGEIVKLIEAEKGLRRDALMAIVPNYDKEIVSAGRWQGWWNGTHPAPVKVELINLLVPKSKGWFLSRMAGAGMHSLHTLLYVVDLWASRRDRSSDAMLLLMELGRVWGPRGILERGVNWRRNKGWCIGGLPKSEIPADIALDHYRALEPSSLIEWMIWTGDFLKVHDTKLFVTWVFDLVSASLATQTLMQEAGDDAVTLAGESADVMAFVLDVFVNQSERYLDPKTAVRSIKPRINSVNGPTSSDPDRTFRLPTTPECQSLILAAAHLFDAELERHGISVASIRDLDPHMYWFNQAPA